MLKFRDILPYVLMKHLIVEYEVVKNERCFRAEPPPPD